MGSSPIPDHVSDSPVAGPSKVGYHAERMSAYLAGENIYPVCLELDLTSACTLSCPECPSTRAPQRHSLPGATIDHLLKVLGGRTTGLLLTGGEPTMAPSFGPTLARARECGFKEIAVVTNGSLLDDPAVSDALVRYATAVRLSLYGWDDASAENYKTTLCRIGRLRERIESAGSALEIGVSALTSDRCVDRLGTIADQVRAAGAHWLYFHPLCRKWGVGHPELADQHGVRAEVARLEASSPDGFRVYALQDRYVASPIFFEGYHAAHFLLVVGADGANYLAPEVKYQPAHVIACLDDHWDEGFLWARARLQRIAAVRSASYPAVGSRHRGILYSHFMEALRRGDAAAQHDLQVAAQCGFRFPHIL